MYNLQYDLFSLDIDLWKINGVKHLCFYVFEFPLTPCQGWSGGPAQGHKTAELGKLTLKWRQD